MPDQLIRGDADEPGCQSALRSKRLSRSFCDLANGFRYGNIFREVEIMQSSIACDFGNGHVAKVWQSRHDSDWLVFRDVRGKLVLVAGVQHKRVDIFEAVSVSDLGSGALTCVGQLHSVVAGLGQQARYQSADLAGAENQNILH